jgi:hypothetical protein
VFLYQNQGKISFLTFLNHGKDGKAYAIKKANISCPEPVSQFLALLKSLESSFGTNSRFGLGLGSLEKNCWQLKFVLETFWVFVSAWRAPWH